MTNGPKLKKKKLQAWDYFQLSSIWWFYLEIASVLVITKYIKKYLCSNITQTYHYFPPTGFQHLPTILVSAVCLSGISTSLYGFAS